MPDFSMIRILVNGAQGKMGQETVRAIQADPELSLVAQASRDDDLAALIHSSQAQVVVDFTTAAQVFATANTIIQAGAHPVIGTSGLRSEQIHQLQKLCAQKKLGGIIAGLGIVPISCFKFKLFLTFFFPSQLKGLPPILHFGSQYLKDKVAKDCLTGTCKT